MRYGGVAGTGWGSLAALLVLWLIPGALSRSHAQLPSLAPPAEAPLPKGVKRSGEVETAPVEFEGLLLFEVASPAIYDRDKPGKDVPVEVRAGHIHDDLSEFLQVLILEDRKAAYDEQTPLEAGTNNIAIETLKGEVVLVARGSGLRHPKTLLAVTPLDATTQQKTPQLLAVEWRQKLVDTLSDAVRAHRPEAQRERIAEVRDILLTVVVVHAFLYGLNRVLLRWQKRLRAAIEAGATEGVSPESIPSVPPLKEVSPRLLGRELPLRNRFKGVVLLRWLLFWVISACWVGGTTLCLFLFPQTRKAGLYLTATPLMILIALFVAGLVNRVTDLIVEGFTENWRANHFFDGSGARHIEARVTTISGVVRALKFFCIYTLALIWVLSRLNVVPWSLVTIGAATALAVSFAVQSLIKDAVMGVLILLEDQFALGDQITVDNTTGTVEYMNLRITRLRATDGRLITLPNNLITKVENLSRSWSISSVEFDVPLTANADQVIEQSRRIAAEMAQEPEWEGVITDPNKWSGVSHIARGAMTVVIAVQTKPAQHAAVGRELRRRIKNVLDEEGIVWRGFAETEEATPG